MTGAGARECRAGCAPEACEGNHPVHVVQPSLDQPHGAGTLAGGSGVEQQDDTAAVSLKGLTHPAARTCRQPSPPAPPISSTAGFTPLRFTSWQRVYGDENNRATLPRSWTNRTTLETQTQASALGLCLAWRPRQQASCCSSAAMLGGHSRHGGLPLPTPCWDYPPTIHPDAAPPCPPCRRGGRVRSTPGLQPDGVAVELMVALCNRVRARGVACTRAGAGGGARATAPPSRGLRSGNPAECSSTSALL